MLRSSGVSVDVVDDAECVAMMTRFITENPDLWNEDIGEV
jgi:creatinine deaminase